MHRCSTIRATRESWAEIIGRLRACGARLPASRKELDELEIVHGVNYCAQGVAFSLDFPLSPLHNINDWLHTYLGSGLLDVELGEVMFELRRRGARTTWTTFGEYL